MESRFPAWRPSLFLFLRLVSHRLVVGKCHGNITPVPADVVDAVDDELAEEWMLLLVAFVNNELRPVTNAGEASTAASIRESFSQYAGVPKKEAGLKLARKGFMEETMNYRVGVKYTTKRTYRLRLDGANVLVSLKEQGKACCSGHH